MAICSIPTSRKRRGAGHLPVRTALLCHLHHGLAGWRGSDRDHSGSRRRPFHPAAAARGERARVLLWRRAGFHVAPGPLPDDLERRHRPLARAREPDVRRGLGPESARDFPLGRKRPSGRPIPYGDANTWNTLGSTIEKLGGHHHLLNAGVSHSSSSATPQGTPPNSQIASAAASRGPSLGSPTGAGCR